MNKKCYRFYGGLLNAQENWLNKMAKKGYRLIMVKKTLYEFESCKPGQYQYYIEFIGHKSKMNAENYRTFLEDMGYTVFYKNINLNYSIGKIRYRPWAEWGGHFATNSTTYNKELLIIERKSDEKPFMLYTSFEDLINYYKSLRNPWLCFFLLFFILGIIGQSFAVLIIGLISLIPTILYQFKVFKYKKTSQIKES
jgi:hypothetical protein